LEPGLWATTLPLICQGHKYEVILKDLIDELLDKARNNIKKTYNFVKMMKKNYFLSSLDELLSRIM
jgi:hypothetical protein